MNAENLNVTAGTANLQTQVPGAPATVSSAAEVTGGVAAGSFVETDIDDELFQFNSDDTASRKAGQGKQPGSGALHDR